ncbi:YaaR family protein [Jeotgalibacillus proteolyticus]|uniref:YaaR family protein n=1 Tax=Jeotgalibacillus proteolyticus TaxID=2082395 RepID=UPI003CECEEBD
MEIQRISKTGPAKASAKAETAKESTSFSEVMAKKRGSTLIDKMTAMSKEIEDQGKVLAESRSVEDLKKYKKLVKQFMEEAVGNALQLEDQRGFNRRGRTKVYKIVKEVDKGLVDLTNSVLQKEQKGIDILSKIGQIQGMLINVYT